MIIQEAKEALFNFGLWYYTTKETINHQKGEKKKQPV